MESMASNAEKILIVDDAAFSRKSIHEVLESNGYNVVGEASSAKEAFTSIALLSPNILIVDVVMPDATGIELARYLNENATSQIFIIIISSLAQEHIIIESISAGAMDFIQKPFSPEVLLQSVAKITAVVQKEQEKARERQEKEQQNLLQLQENAASKKKQWT